MSNRREPANEAVIPPSSLLIFLPGDDPPMAEEIRLRLQDWGQLANLDESDADAEDTLWSFGFEREFSEQHNLIWCERIQGEHLRLLDDVCWRSADQRRQARECRWLVGMEVHLSPPTPIVDFRRQLELANVLAEGWSPVVFDASACLFRTPQDIQQLVKGKTHPRNSCLYSIHKIPTGLDRAGQPLYWVHTHGLERAGAPELEIFDVPKRLLSACCELFESLTDLWLEFGTPDPQLTFAVGRGLELCWRPWQAAAVTMGKETVGGWEFRKAEHGHTGYRAVLSEPQQSGWFGKRWAPPISVLERLTQPDATLFKTQAETSRVACMAKERWGEFGLLFASNRYSNWRFAVKLGFPADDDAKRSEHLWFDVVRLQPGKIQAKLVSTPTIVQGIEVGQISWQELTKLTDWRVFTPIGAFGPETAELLFDEPLALAQ